MHKPVRQLNPEVARKIAAGEVIDRPNAIVRELLDNAIDAGAEQITVEIAGGGIEKVRVVDNGGGMTMQDLQNCARPHATSKISSETDLLNLTTLGFRGEALASIAAVCRLSINSSGFRMRASVTEDHIIEETANFGGTIVQAEGLFENFPARRVFLKRPATEGLLCKNTFIEKSLPCPEKAFRFISDGIIKIDLPAKQTLKERFVKAMEIKESPELFYEISTKSPSNPSEWSFKIIIGEPGIFKANKKDIHIFVNGRKINEYSLVQAIEYGGQGYFPNGAFPVAAAFIEISPSLVDFNIHPAKKEVRFKDISDLHHAVSSSVRKFLAEYTRKIMIFTPDKNQDTQMQNLFEETDKTFPNAQDFSSKYTFSNSSRNNYSKSIHVADSGFKAKSTSPVDQKNENLIASKDIEDKDKKIFKIQSFAEKAIIAYNRTYNENTSNILSKTQEIEQKNEMHTNFQSMTEYKNLASGEKKEIRTDSSTFVKNAFEAFKSNAMSDFTKTGGKKFSDKYSSEFHFLGSALGTFLVAEKEGILYIIDKHAAHERILFDQIMENQGKRQKLLVPYIVHTNSKDEDEYMASIVEELDKFGFECKQAEDGKWEFYSLNERWKGNEEALQKELLENHSSPDKLIYDMAASASCKAAVKDGWQLDDAAASEIAEKALILKDPHCPHGRPIYTAISREQLFQLVRRT